MLAKVSTLLIRVGWPQRPLSAGVGGARSRLSAQSLDGGHQSGFLSADEGAGAEPDLHLERKLGLAHVGAEEARALGLADRGLQTLHRQRIFGAYIDVSLVGADGVGGDRHALEHAMGVGLQDRPVHEGPGIALVGIADHVFLLGRHLGHGRPLEAGRVAASAPPPQSACGNLTQHVGRGHLGQCLHQRRVTPDRHVALEAVRVDHARVLEHDLLLAGEKRLIRGAHQALHRGRPDAAHDVLGIIGADLPIEDRGLLVVRGNRDQRSRGAQPHASDPFDAAAVAVGHRRLQRLEHRLRPGGLTAGRHADPHLVRDVRIRGADLLGQLGQIVEIHVSRAP